MWARELLLINQSTPEEASPETFRNGFRGFVRCNPATRVLHSCTNFFHAIAGRHQPAGQVWTKHRQVIYVISCHKCPVSIRTAEAGHFAEGRALVVLNVAEPRIHVIAHDGHFRPRFRPFLEPAHNCHGFIEIAGDEAEWRPGILEDAGTEVLVDPREQRRQFMAKPGEKLFVYPCAPVIPGVMAQVTRTIMPVDLTLHHHDIIRLHRQTRTRHLFHQTGKIASGIDDPADSLRLQLRDQFLKLRSDRRMGAFQMDCTVKISADELKCGW